MLTDKRNRPGNTPLNAILFFCAVHETMYDVAVENNWRPYEALYSVDLLRLTKYFIHVRC